MAAEGAEAASVIGVKLTLDAGQFMSGMTKAQGEVNKLQQQNARAGSGAAGMKAGGGKQTASGPSSAQSLTGVNVSLTLSSAELAGLRKQVQGALQNIPITVTAQMAKTARGEAQSVVAAVSTPAIGTRTGARHAVDSAVAQNLPKKAHGGAVQQGRDILVGERRPEVFRPTTHGYIEPDPSRYYREQEQRARREADLARQHQGRMIQIQHRAQAGPAKAGGLPRGYKLIFYASKDEAEKVRYGPGGFVPWDDIKPVQKPIIKPGYRKGKPPSTSGLFPVIYKGTEIVGTYPMSYDDIGDVLHPEMSYTADAHRRKGLATAAYKKAELFTGKSVQYSDNQLLHGRAFWHYGADEPGHRERPFGKKFGRRSLSPDDKRRLLEEQVMGQAVGLAPAHVGYGPIGQRIRQQSIIRWRTREFERLRNQGMSLREAADQITQTEWDHKEGSLVGSPEPWMQLRQKGGRVRPSRSLEARAFRMFGETDEITEAGYLSPSGRYLDFSGRHEASGYRHEGNRWVPAGKRGRKRQIDVNLGPNVPPRSTWASEGDDYLAYSRNVDHRQVWPLFPNVHAEPERYGRGPNAMDAMIGRGWVRMFNADPDAGEFMGTISRPMTDAQMARIRRDMPSRSTAIMDVQDRAGRTRGSFGETDSERPGTPLGRVMREANELARRRRQGGGRVNVKGVESNLRHYFASADARQRGEGMEWYDLWGGKLREAAARTGYAPELLTSVTAALSPRTRWPKNFDDAVRFAEAHQAGLPQPPASGFPANRNKAWRILDEADAGHLKGIKVQPFGGALLGDPNATPQDMWMHRAGLGNLLAEVPAPPKGMQKELDRVTRLIAQEQGIEPRQAQAIIWGVARDQGLELAKQYRRQLKRTKRADGGIARAAQGMRFTDTSPGVRGRIMEFLQQAYPNAHLENLDSATLRNLTSLSNVSGMLKERYPKTAGSLEGISLLMPGEIAGLGGLRAFGDFEGRNVFGQTEYASRSFVNGQIKAGGPARISLHRGLLQSDQASDYLRGLTESGHFAAIKSPGELLLHEMMHALDARNELYGTVAMQALGDIPSPSRYAGHDPSEQFAEWGTLFHGLREGDRARVPSDIRELFGRLEGRKSGGHARRGAVTDLPAKPNLRFGRDFAGSPMPYVTPDYYWQQQGPRGRHEPEWRRAMTASPYEALQAFSRQHMKSYGPEMLASPRPANAWWAQGKSDLAAMGEFETYANILAKKLRPMAGGGRATNMWLKGNQSAGSIGAATEVDPGYKRLKGQLSIEDLNARRKAAGQSTFGSETGQYPIEEGLIHEAGDIPRRFKSLRLKPKSTKQGDPKAFEAAVAEIEKYNASRDAADDASTKAADDRLRAIRAQMIAKNEPDVTMAEKQEELAAAQELAQLRGRPAGAPLGTRLTNPKPASAPVASEARRLRIYEDIFAKGGARKVLGRGEKFIASAGPELDKIAQGLLDKFIAEPPEWATETGRYDPKSTHQQLKELLESGRGPLQALGWAHRQGQGKDAPYVHGPVSGSVGAWEEHLFSLAGAVSRGENAKKGTTARNLQENYFPWTLVEEAKKGQKAKPVVDAETDRIHAESKARIDARNERVASSIEAVNPSAGAIYRAANPTVVDQVVRDELAKLEAEGALPRRRPPVVPQHEAPEVIAHTAIADEGLARRAARAVEEIVAATPPVAGRIGYPRSALELFEINRAKADQLRRADVVKRMESLGLFTSSRRHRAAGGGAGEGLYIVGEIGEELFVPNRLTNRIPKKVMDQIPRAAGGMMVIGKRRNELFAPPEDGIIVPNRLMDQVPHAMAGVRADQDPASPGPILTTGAFSPTGPLVGALKANTAQTMALTVAQTNAVTVYGETFKALAPLGPAIPLGKSTPRGYPIPMGPVPAQLVAGGEEPMKLLGPGSDVIRYGGGKAPTDMPGILPGGVARTKWGAEKIDKKGMVFAGPPGSGWAATGTQIKEATAGAPAATTAESATAPTEAAARVFVPNKGMKASVKAAQNAGWTDEQLEKAGLGTFAELGAMPTALKNRLSQSAMATRAMGKRELAHQEVRARAERAEGYTELGQNPAVAEARELLLPGSGYMREGSTRTSAAVFGGLFSGGEAFRRKQQEAVTSRGQFLEAESIRKHWDTRVKIDQFGLKDVETQLKDANIPEEKRAELLHDQALLTKELASDQRTLASATKVAGLAAEDFTLKVHRAQPTFLSAARNFSGQMVGMTAFGIGMTAVGLTIKTAAPAVESLVDQIMGWQGISTATTSALGKQTSEAHGNVKAVLAQATATAGLSEASSDYVKNALSSTLLAKAAAKAQQETMDLFRSSKYQQGEPPQGLYAGYGGLFGSSFLAETMGGSKGFMENVAGTFAGNRPAAADPLKNAGLALDLLTNADTRNLILGEGKAQGGSPLNTIADVVGGAGDIVRDFPGIGGLAGIALTALIPKTPNYDPMQTGSYNPKVGLEPTGIAANEVALDDLNKAAVRGGEALSSTANVHWGYATSIAEENAAVTNSIVSRDKESASLARNSHIVMRVGDEISNVWDAQANKWVQVTGHVASAAEHMQAVTQTMTGKTIADVTTWASGMARQISAAFQMSALQGQRARDLSIPWSVSTQLLEQPLTTPGIEAFPGAAQGKPSGVAAGMTPGAAKMAEGWLADARTAQGKLTDLAQEGYDKQLANLKQNLGPAPAPTGPLPAVGSAGKKAPQGTIMPGYPNLSAPYTPSPSQVLAPEMAGAASGQNPLIKEFEDLYAGSQAASKAIADTTNALGEMQAQASLTSWRNSIRLAERSLGDALGRAGKGSFKDASGKTVAATNMGKWERASHFLDVASTKLSLALQQRSITTQLAVAQFQAPGETGEERYFKQKQAIAEAGVAQQQLKIATNQFSLSQKMWVESANRAATDAQKAIDVMVASRNVELATIAAQKKIAEESKLFAANIARMNTITGEADTNWGTVASAAVGGIKDFTGSLAQGIEAIYKSLGYTVTQGKNNTTIFKPGTGPSQYGEPVTIGGNSGYSSTPTSPKPVGGGLIPGKDWYWNGYKWTQSRANAMGYLGGFSQGALMTVGEAGPETVAILRNPRAASMSDYMGGGGGSANVTVNINGPVVRNDQDISSLARQVAAEVERTLSRKGQMFGLRGPAV